VFLQARPAKNIVEKNAANRLLDFMTATC
jgi:hypothetical protein